MLRKTVIRELKDVLNKSVFTLDDFSLTLEAVGEEDADFLFGLVFIHDTAFDYQVRSAVEGIWASRSPGDITNSEDRRIGDWSDCLCDVDDWCSEIREELKASNPIYSEIDEIRNLIEKQLNVDASDEEEFSVSEINDLLRKFEELKTRVESLEQDQIITKKQLEEFNSGVNQVKEDLQVYPKTTWYKVATNKLVNTVVSIAKSKEGRDLLATGANKLFGLG